LLVNSILASHRGAFGYAHRAHLSETARNCRNTLGAPPFGAPATGYGASGAKFMAVIDYALPQLSGDGGQRPKTCCLPGPAMHSTLHGQ
jgi:hypothetical protein